MKFLFLFITSLLFSFNLQAQNSCGESLELKKEKYLKAEHLSTPNIQVIQNCGCSNGCQKKEEKVKIIYRDRVVKSKPKIIYRDRVVYKDRIVYRDKEVPVPVKEEKVVYKPVYKTKYKTKYRTRTKYVERPYANYGLIQPQRRRYRHAINLLGLATPTDLRVRYSSYNHAWEGGSNVDVTQHYEADFGLLYQFDANRVRFSIGGTLGGIGILGLGWVF